MSRITVFVLVIFLFSNCKTNSSSSDQTATTEVALVKTPAFSGDSAYLFVDKQVRFGPRVPNSQPHIKCGDYLVTMLKKYGCTVYEQKFVATTYDGKKLNARNIIGSVNPQTAKRILLASHWDSRPMADQDETHKTGAIDGANDGASGVGILVELARTIQQATKKPDIGVDLIFFDVEDGGSSLAKDEYGGFCLGSQYWAANKHLPNYSAYYGVLLDMVGAKGATFPREGFSNQYAADVTKNMWHIASRLGYNQYFIDQDGGSITDDHLPVNKIAKIPMLDIIHTQVNSQTKTFFDHWHTHQDGMQNIDRATLKAVGQVLLQAIYEEKP
jgi:glutaminyl-peptide cyclotransferase